MKVFLLPSFIEDIKEFDDPSFAKRVFNQIFDSRGDFKRGQNDHRLHGIDDAWIRYISRGRTAYRLIYIQTGDNVYLYKVGNHSIEDNITGPSSLSSNVGIGSVPVGRQASVQSQNDFGMLLQNTNPVFLKTVVGSLYHVGHHDIILVSPFFSKHIFSSHHHFGRFLDKCVEERTNVIFVTLPPKDNDFTFFDDLEARDILVYFYDNLHTKLYLFNVNKTTLSYYNRDEIKNTAIVGSSNLTECGFAFESQCFNEELCFRVPESKFSDFQQYSANLINHAYDLRSYKMRARRF